MHDFNDILQTSCNQYQLLYSNIVEAVDFAHKQRFAAAAAKAGEMGLLLKDIEETDKVLNSLSNKELIEKYSDLWRLRAQRIKSTLAFHEQHLPHLNSIMAMQISEIQKIRTGIRGMNGYYAAATQTGSRISDSS